MNRKESSIRETQLRFPLRIWMLGVAACLLLCTHLQVAAVELPGPSVPDGMGVQISFTIPAAGELEMIADAGFSWVRMDFDWAATEQTAGVYSFVYYDYLMLKLGQNNLRALFTLDYDNPLYNNGFSPSTPASRTAFANWAVAAMEHFADRGIVWELWNEPEMIYMGNSFWTPAPNVNDYSALAVAVGQAMQPTVPNEILIGPAAALYAPAFIEASFQLGVLEYFSAVSVHPYPLDDYVSGTGPEENFARYDWLRTKIDLYKPPGKSIPIISSEQGYPSNGWPNPNLDETEQGKLVSRKYLVDMANDVAISNWYNWKSGPNPSDPEHNFGMVRSEYLFPAPSVWDGSSYVREPKPAFWAARTLAHLLDGFQFDERLAVGDADDYVLEFVNGGETRLVLWTTLSTVHPVVVSVPAGVYAAFGHTGEFLWTREANELGLSVALTDAPLYLVPYLPGDTNGDGAVDAEDAATLATYWQQTDLTGGIGVGDFDEDGDVDDVDATILAANWGVGTAASVPEPAALILILGAILTFGLFRRRTVR